MFRLDKIQDRIPSVEKKRSELEANPHETESWNCPPKEVTLTLKGDSETGNFTKTRKKRLSDRDCQALKVKMTLRRHSRRPVSSEPQLQLAYDENKNQIGQHQKIEIISVDPHEEDGRKKDEEYEDGLKRNLPESFDEAINWSSVVPSVQPHRSISNTMNVIFFSDIFCSNSENERNELND